MGYNRRKLKMKKSILTVALIIVSVVCSLMLSSFTKNESSQNNESSDLYMVAGDDCRFEVTNVDTSISGTTVTLTVTVRPAFTPSEAGFYTVVVRPQGPMAQILNSQTKEVRFQYCTTTGTHQLKWKDSSKTVNFECSVMNNSYNQCSSNSFTCTCFKD